jgi:hypothetical protein|tara:strand:- start:1057 stop:1239 length:183 start_codon:yes stop_codon:yes gene_type:complete
MKLSMTLGRKGDKFKTLYAGGDAGAAVAAMAAEVKAEKQRFDEVLLYKAPLPFKRRRLTA